MSDGMSDANALGRLARELTEAAYRLRDAIQEADDGHRGYSIDVIKTVNGVLNRSASPVGFKLVHAMKAEIWR